MISVCVCLFLFYPLYFFLFQVRFPFSQGLSPLYDRRSDTIWRAGSEAAVCRVSSLWDFIHSAAWSSRMSVVAEAIMHYYHKLIMHLSGTIKQKCWHRKYLRSGRSSPWLFSTEVHIMQHLFLQNGPGVARRASNNSKSVHQFPFPSLSVDYTSQGNNCLGRFPKVSFLVRTLLRIKPLLLYLWWLLTRACKKPRLL